jgi:ACS family hexuronate transporter-like MFS transporter
MGLAGMGGAVGGIVIAQTAGHVLQATGSYHALFALAAGAYLLALGVIHALSPRLAPTVALASTSEKVSS